MGKVKFEIGAEFDMLNKEELHGALAHHRRVSDADTLLGKKYRRMPPLIGAATAAGLNIGGDTPWPVVFGQAAAPATPIGPSEGYVWSIKFLSVGGLASGAAAGASVNANGGVASPGAGAVITSAALPAGTYTVSWTVSLGGTLGGGDSNNFALKLGAATVQTSSNPAAAGSYPQVPVVIVVPAGGATLSINAVAAGTAGSFYAGQFSAAPAATADDKVNLFIIGASGSVPWWQFTATNFAKNFGKGDLIVMPGERLALQSAGTFNSTATIRLIGSVWQVPAEKLGYLF